MKTNKPIIPLFIITLPFIVIIIIGTLAISVMSTMENKRFIDGTNLILSVPKAVTTLLKTRPVTLMPNDNILDMLSNVSLFPKKPEYSDYSNPWGGQFQAFAVDNNIFRIHTVITPSVCRKLSLYFGKYDFSNVGLSAMYANPDNNVDSWAVTFSKAKKEPASKIGTACGNGASTRTIIEFSVVK